MLETLYIKNFAIINELEVNFYPGLNVLSGETGAGKSIIIGSINFVLGGKADRSIIKKDADSCEVSMLISIENSLTRSKIAELDMDIDIGEDNSILIKRSFSKSGKSNCRINGRAATVSMIRQITSLLFDIHSQHDNHKLLNSKNHIDILDRLCGSSIETYKKDLSNKIADYNKVKNRIKELDSQDSENLEKIDFYKFQINEISEADLRIGEEEELESRRLILKNSVKLQNYCDNILGLLYRNDSGAAIDSISQSLIDLESISQIDDSVSETLEELNSAYSLIEDAVGFIRSYSDNIDYDPEELENIDDRLNLIHSLKKKYGASIEDILNFLDKTSKKLDELLNSEEIVEKLKIELNNIERSILSICDKISEIRKDVAYDYQGKIQTALHELCMESAEFKILLEKSEKFKINGNDNVEFLISANKGGSLQPLIKVASGGEMSRVMLALKSVLADSDTIDTFIFDEIDTGISGRTAQKVAEKLNVIAKNRQILCITHLPQIAAMADKNYLIEKKEINQSTETLIFELDEDCAYSEIARLIGGAEITGSTLAAAKEMKDLANKIKGE